MRGLSFNRGELAVANYSAIFFFDRNWNLLRVFSHPLISAIHEVLYANDGLWVTSTANDLLAKFDLVGNLQRLEYLRSQRDLMIQLGGPLRQLLKPGDAAGSKMDFRRRTYFVSDVYDHTHLNGVIQTCDGSLFLSMGLIVGDIFSLFMNLKTAMMKLGLWKAFLAFNRWIGRSLGLKRKMFSDLVLQPVTGKSAVVSVSPHGEWKIHLVIPVTHNPSHSLRILDDGTALYLATSSGEMIHFDLNGNILSKTKVTERFLRGLAILPGRELLMGADNKLLVFDFAAKKITAEIEIAENPKTSIFDIQILPPDFELPPPSLESKCGRITGFAGRRVVWKVHEDPRSCS